MFIILLTAASPAETVDTLDVVPLSGETRDNYFGAAVSGGGDLNGDGYDDAVIGASEYNSNSGRAYLLYGGPDGASDAALTALEVADSTLFGVSVAGAGDLTGDGIADVVVGESTFDAGRGRLHVFPGGVSGVAATASMVLEGDSTMDYFAHQLAGAGDVDGDGHDDLLVLQPALYEGAHIYLFSGSADGLLPDAERLYVGEDESDVFGEAMAGAGDVNGDGYDDVIIGSPTSSEGEVGAYLYYGSAAGLPPSEDALLYSEGSREWFGGSVAGAGDLNGDGYGDLLIGAPSYDDRRGRVYVYLGDGGGLETTPGATLEADGDEQSFGGSVSGAGDVNGDGYADAIVGATRHDDDRGRAALFYGSAEGLVVAPVFTLDGENTDDRLGLTLSALGDVNGDGLDDAIVGAPVYDGRRGRAYVLQSGTWSADTGGPGVDTAAGEAPADGEKAGGCGCSGAGLPMAPWALLLIPAALLRRREPGG